MSKFHGMDYRPVVPRNTRNIGKVPSRTPGKSKGENCQTDPTKRFWFSSPKAYLRKGYAQWHQKAKDANNKRV